MNIYRLYRRIIPRSKPAWATLCKLAYEDSNGMRYYQYQDELDMSLFRRGEIEKAKMELRYGTDYTDVVNGIKGAINRPNRKSGRMEPDIATAGYLVQELIDRKDLLIIPEILFKICATTLIREDENPYLVDQEILEQKIAVFKHEIQRGGLHAFFQESGLLNLINLPNISRAELTRLMIDSEQRLKQVQARIKLCTSEQRSPDFYSSKTNTI